jgi:hypothetical protein
MNRSCSPPHVGLLFDVEIYCDRCSWLLLYLILFRRSPRSCFEIILFATLCYSARIFELFLFLLSLFLFLLLELPLQFFVAFDVPPVACSFRVPDSLRHREEHFRFLNFGAVREAKTQMKSYLSSHSLMRAVNDVMIHLF